MIYSARNAPAPGEYPAGSEIGESDWHILASFWHPVAFVSELGPQPVPFRLLDVDLVIWRTRDAIAVARDRCPHRGAKLSLGWVEETGTSIVCPFHGNHYDVTGTCTRVPSFSDAGMPIPARMRLATCRVEVRYGLVWCCLKEEALRPLPDWPLLDRPGPGWVRVEIPRGRWQTSAGRHCENFNDIAHISWVHMKTFGNRAHPEVPEYALERTACGLRMELPYIEVERGFNDDALGERRVWYSHELTYPYATDLRVDYSDTMTSHFYDIGTPISAGETAIFQVSLTNVPGANAKDYAAYQLVTNSEDVPVVESQQPCPVPLNAAHEVHVPADRFSIQYRRDLAELFGLGAR